MYKKCFVILLSLDKQLLYAAPSDHGRWYDESSYSEWGLFDIFGLILLVGIIIFWISLKLNSSKPSGKSSSSYLANASSAQGHQETDTIKEWGAYTKCPKCNGRGSWKGDMVSFDDRGFDTCPECHGYKKLFTETAKIKYEQLQDCKKRYKGNYIAILGYKRSLEKELENSGQCPRCKGKGIIRHYEIIETDTGRYKKEVCDKCNGLGMLKDGKTIPIPEQ